MLSIVTPKFKQGSASNVELSSHSPHMYIEQDIGNYRRRSTSSIFSEHFCQHTPARFS